MVLSLLIYVTLVVEVVGAAATAVLLGHRTGWGRRPPPLAEGETYGSWLAFCAGAWPLGALLAAWWHWRGHRHAEPGTPPAPTRGGPASEDSDAHPRNYTPVASPVTTPTRKVTSRKERR